VSQITKRPEAEVVVDTETVRTLLKAQHPDLADLPLSEIATGWDNFIYRLGEGMSVRLPRRGLPVLPCWNVSSGGSRRLRTVYRYR
jgi:aminoglycoside phosphotransferase (APT) family kinase protein